MANSPAQAVAKSQSITRGYGGMCLAFVRTCYDIGSKYPSAESAWFNATTRHATTDLSVVPVGAPLCFKSPGHNLGHIAVYLGNGQMRSSSSKADNRIHTLAVSSYLKMGYVMRGWIEDINGVGISGLAPVSKPVAPAPSSGTLAIGSNNARVGALQAGLRRLFPAYKDFVAVKRGVLIGVDNDFGPQTDAWVKEFQRRTGLEPDGVVGPLTTAMLAKYGITL